MDEQPSEPSWQYKDDGSNSSELEKVSDNSPSQGVLRDPKMQSEIGEIEWTASEFVDHKKPAWWYLALALIVAGIAALVYFFSGGYVAAASVVAVGVLFGVIAARPPRSLNYRLDGRGLSVSGKLYPYRHFKAFWTAREGAACSLNFLPLRRFMPILTVYYDPADESKISDLLGSILPLESARKDVIDKFLQKIRF